MPGTPGIEVEDIAQRHGPNTGALVMCCNRPVCKGAWPLAQAALAIDLAG